MRPDLLDPFFAPAATLPGVGPKNAKLFDRLLSRDGRSALALDVLFHLPYASLDRRARPKIRDAVWDQIATIEVKVVEHRPPPSPRSKAPFKVLVEDDTGDVELVFFLANMDWIKREIKKEAFISVFGLPAGYQVELKDDPQVLKAIETIPQARALYQNVRHITAQRTGTQPLQP